MMPATCNRIGMTTPIACAVDAKNDVSACAPGPFTHALMDSRLVISDPRKLPSPAADAARNTPPMMPPSSPSTAPSCFATATPCANHCCICPDSWARTRNSDSDRAAPAIPSVIGPNTCALPAPIARMPGTRLPSADPRLPAMFPDSARNVLTTLAPRAELMNPSADLAPSLNPSTTDSIESRTGPSSRCSCSICGASPANIAS